MSPITSCATTKALLRDPNSAANILEFVTKHIRLDWKIDFTAKKIFGNATLSMKKLAAEPSIKLDCSHIYVKNVYLGDKKMKTAFSTDNKSFKFGGFLIIDCASIGVNEEFDVSIDYETTKDCSALQWLNAEQTVGKKYPYLFSQCQAIHARTMLPCQDTPAIKATFSARVTVSAPLAVVMSANRRQIVQTNDNTLCSYEFEQTTPIPSYLIAIGAGAIESKAIGPRSVVWSEAEMIDAAAYEFADTEKFISTAESLVGPYVWERYDILLLPPSFPYGGMENPCLTFLTPSLLCGDRSLVDVVAHEISHSWTGNLVSCMNWEHFWLNEGFTMFLERNILSRLHGEGWRQFNSQIGLADLRESIAQFKGDGPETALTPDLTHTDPDDVFSTVPYEKGYTLLYVLEELVGGPSAFEPFFKAHIQKFAGQSIVSEQFKGFIFEYFSQDFEISEKLKEFPWDHWFVGRGMPVQIPDYSKEMSIPCVLLADSCIDSEGVDEQATNTFKSFTPEQKTMFLDLLLQKAKQFKANPAIISSLNSKLSLSTSKNVEILLKFYLICIRAGVQEFFTDAAKFATLHGRMKYCRPVLRELSESGQYGKQIAIETFEASRSFYHPIARQMIIKDLHLSS